MFIQSDTERYSAFDSSLVQHLQRFQRQRMQRVRRRVTVRSPVRISPLTFWVTALLMIPRKPDLALSCRSEGAGRYRMRGCGKHQHVLHWSPWRWLGLSSLELSLARTLQNGQCFSWTRIEREYDRPRYRAVLYSTLVEMEEHLNPKGPQYRTFGDANGKSWF